MRVAVRRLRAILRMFGQVVSQTPTANTWPPSSKWLGRTPRPRARRRGAPRAPAVPSLRPVPRELLDRPGPGPRPGPLCAPAGRRARRAARGARLAPLRRLLAELDTLTARPQPGPKAAAPGPRPPADGRQPGLRQAERRTRRARHTPPGPARDVALHRARESARRARDAAQAAAPAVGLRPDASPADGAGPVGPRRAPGRRPGPPGRPGPWHRRAPGPRERLHLRPPLRARTRTGPNSCRRTRAGYGSASSCCLATALLDELGPAATRHTRT